jgi:hypothetical protein
LLRHYIENIRCNGKVFFIGFKQSVRIHDNLLVMHGKKWGVNAPKQTLEMRSNALCITAGHSHKPGMFSAVGVREVICYISGCLCLKPAHHNDDEDDEYCNWQHSTVIMTIDVKSGEVDMKDVHFHKNAERVWFEWGGKIFVYKVQSAPVAAAERQAAA